MKLMVDLFVCLKYTSINAAKNTNKTNTKGNKMKYCLKPESPKTIRIGEYDVPEPVCEPLEYNKEYWGVELSATEFACNYKWNNTAFCNLMLCRGLIHLTKEAAAIHAKALLSLTHLDFPRK